jgi:hypothetical protein
MRRTLGVGVVLLLAILLFPSAGFGQQSSERAKSRLGQNYPNPFNPETRIPFVLFDEDFVAGSRSSSRSVSERSRPAHRRAAALDHPEETDVEVENLEYATPG